MLSGTIRLLNVALLGILSIGNIWLFNDQRTNNALSVQLSQEFPVIFIDPFYSIFWGGVLLVVPILLFILPPPFVLKHKKTTNIIASTFTAASLIVIIGVRILEKNYFIQEAKIHGYIECPIFTLARGEPTLKTMALDFEYCFDKHIQKLSEYGYVSNLQGIKDYVNDTYNFHSTPN